jgi:PAS domain S-box-containing protein
MVAWNEPFLRLLGFSHELAYVGAPFERFIRYNAERGEYGPGEINAQVAERVERARSFRSHLTERTRPDGRIISIRGEPLPHKGFVTLYTDITEQRLIENMIQRQNTELEERIRHRTAQLENTNVNLIRANAENVRIASALRRSEERLRLITDTIPAMISYFDHDEIYRYANKGYSDWFAVPGEHVIGNAIRDVVPAAVYQAVKGYIAEGLAGKQVTYEYTAERNGKTVYARSTLIPEISQDGETLGCFVHAFDITAQKHMQAALVQAQKMEAIGQLTGGLAHDFNNLLTVIIGNLAAEQERRSTDTEETDLIEPALQAARRGVQAIKRLLTFSGKQPLEPEATDVSELIGGMTKLIWRTLPDSIAITTDMPESALYALVDPGQLESALLNFVINARDAMTATGQLAITAVTVQLNPGQAAQHAVRPGQYVQIEVSDTGAGMDAATLARVYEPFFTTKRLGLGSGLGLSMAHGFARQSGGSIHIRSAPGKGTIVQLLLPKIAHNPHHAAIAEDFLKGSGEDRKLVLLVEDDAEVRRVVRQQLTDLRYPVVEAKTGAEALELLADLPEIALVLSDVVMHGEINGRDLARQAKLRRPDIRIVLMSGYDESIGDSRLEELPVFVLNKPFDKDELARALVYEAI